ncbi:MAG: hypothetical protein DHS20C16_21930 [Phycisphaerae bacterium]|nr:MAG: hypothetical protein DHS20C16_21930 [Phycisphaerae bacterium]
MGHSRKSVFILGLAFLTLLPSAGCARWGALAYALGAGRGQKLPAEFELPPGKLLILVDDPKERVTWPRARTLLVKYVGEELLDREAVTTVISPRSVAKFRQSDSKFESYAADEIGRKLGAKTVIWIEVRDFEAPEDIEDVSTAAKITLSIKVLTTEEEVSPHGVRLWPTVGSGHIVESSLNAIGVNKIKGENAVAKELARRSAILVARLFYEHTLGDIEDDGV